MKKEDYVKSSPYFFKRILICLVITSVFLLIGGFFYEAPLQEAAEVYNVPNPSKSAWFLLWTQELVSYGNWTVYIIIGLFIIFLFMPFFIKSNFDKGSWFKRNYIVLNIFTLIVFFGIVGLTIVAAFFRGEYWHLIF